jgi:putative flavoprotein involved in K+ transport
MKSLLVALFLLFTGVYAQSATPAIICNQDLLKAGWIKSGTQPVVIIGAGPGGLSTAYELQKLGVPYVILESSAHAGNSFSNMPKDLHLLSAGLSNSLPGFLESTEIGPFTQTSRANYVQYLQDYVKRNQLNIQTDTQVQSLSKDENGVFTLHTSKGDIRASNVVNATGYFGHPFTPPYEGLKTTKIPLLHFAQYKNPAELSKIIGKPNGKVLIIGKRLSAGQVMVELYKSGFQIDLSYRSQIEFGPSPMVMAIEAPFTPIYEWRRSASGNQTAYEIPMEGGLSKELVVSKKVASQPDIKSFHETTVEFVDGSVQKYDAVIFATGFRPALEHLSGLVPLDQKSGMPEINNMQSTLVPGLYFVGLDGEKDYRSRFIRGMRGDAAVVAQTILSQHAKK